MKRAVLFVCCLSLPVFCSPQKKVKGYTAQRLLSDCKAAVAGLDSPGSTSDSSGAEHCIGYLQGFEDMMLMWQIVAEKTPEAKIPLICLPDTVTLEVIARKIPIWAIEHPENGKGAALELLLVMLNKHYPC